MSPWFPLFSGPVPDAEAGRARVVNIAQESERFFVHFASSISSISLDRSGWPCYNMPCCAGVAHLVERHLAKVEVAGSSPVARSIGRTAKAGRFFTKRPALGYPARIPIHSEDAAASSFYRPARRRKRLFHLLRGKSAHGMAGGCNFPANMLQCRRYPVKTQRRRL